MLDIIIQYFREDWYRIFQDIHIGVPLLFNVINFYSIIAVEELQKYLFNL